MRFSKKIAGFVILTACFFAAGCSASEQENESADSRKAAPEQGRAADFTLKNLNGESVSLSGLLKTHKAVLLNFWATWCPPCREEIPGLIDIQKKNSGDSFTIVGVDVGESALKVSNFAQKAGINYPILLDSEQAVGQMYRVVGIPTSYLIASDGKILGEYHAYSPELVTDVENAVK